MKHQVWLVMVNQLLLTANHQPLIVINITIINNTIPCEPVLITSTCAEPIDTEALLANGIAHHQPLLTLIITANRICHQ